MDSAQLANTTASGLVTLCCLTFAIVYHVTAPWRSTAVGRHLMAFTLAIGALAAYTILITIWPDGPAATVLRGLRTTLLVVIAALVLQRTHMVLRAQHKGAMFEARPDKHDPPQ